jgi:hypothetical protein
LQTIFDKKETGLFGYFLPIIKCFDLPFGERKTLSSAEKTICQDCGIKQQMPDKFAFGNLTRDFLTNFVIRNRVRLVDFISVR